MNERDWLAERFEERGRRAVKEAWLRLSRTDAEAIENLGGWLTTVVARVSLDMLRARKARNQQPLEPYVPDPVVSRESGTDPEYEALLADSVALAIPVVLEMLSPDERVAFVLHDMFAVGDRGPLRSGTAEPPRPPPAARTLTPSPGRCSGRPDL
jgi:RNA polymerase sigma-70 factor (ECF subfamily)